MSNKCDYATGIILSCQHSAIQGSHVAIVTNELLFHVLMCTLTVVWSSSHAHWTWLEVYYNIQLQSNSTLRLIRALHVSFNGLWCVYLQWSGWQSPVEIEQYLKKHWEMWFMSHVIHVIIIVSIAVTCLHMLSQVRTPTAFLTFHRTSV